MEMFADAAWKGVVAVQPGRLDFIKTSGSMFRIERRLSHSNKKAKHLHEAVAHSAGHIVGRGVGKGD